MNQSLVAAVLAGGLLGGAAGCGLPEGDYLGKIPKPSDIDPGHLRWCNSGEPESLDPAMASTTTAIKLVFAMFDGLINYDLHGNPVSPGLAASWEASADQRRFTFHLRQGATWTDGTPITAYDAAYSIVRVLHPLTASPNSKAATYFKNGDAFAANAVRVVMNDVDGLAAGALVTIEGIGADAGADPAATAWATAKDRPDPNTRTGSSRLALRDLGAPVSAAYATLAPGSKITIIEISGRRATLPSPGDGGTPWAYVHAARGSDAIYGWVPLSDLDGAPNADVVYRVKAVAPNQLPGDYDPAAVARDTIHRVRGADLLMLPETLGMSVPDPFTLVLETPDPTPFLFDQIVHRAFRLTPRHAVSRAPTRWFNPRYTKDVVSSGPMRIASWRERDYVQLVRWPSYWDNASTKLDKLTAYSIDDQVASVNFYISGGCDATTTNNVPASYIPIVNGERRGGRAYKDYFVARYLGIYFILVNNEKLNNRHLRRALALAIDRAQLPRITKAGETPSAQLTPGVPISQMSEADRALCGVTADTPGIASIIEPGKYCYVPPPGLDFNPAQAKLELELARKEMGAAFPKTIVYKYNSGVEQHKLIAEFLQEQWREHLGMATTLESQEWKVYIADTRQGNYELGRFGNIMNFADPEPQMLSNFMCKSPDNRLKYCDPAYEDVMGQARREPDRAKRLLLARQAEAMLLDAGAIIPLLVYTQKTLQMPYVKDLAITFNDQSPIQKAYLDPNWQSAVTP
ncbi:MAG: peptide ABC transporter substrate-binding protein [Myxococcales bacterium]|nr:peptide ABC transporter substrate-binding protein [Myxococcales bacterium]